MYSLANPPQNPTIDGKSQGKKTPLKEPQRTDRRAIDVTCTEHNNKTITVYAM